MILQKIFKNIKAQKRKPGGGERRGAPVELGVNAHAAQVIFKLPEAKGQIFACDSPVCLLYEPQTASSLYICADYAYPLENFSLVRRVFQHFKELLQQAQLRSHLQRQLVVDAVLFRNRGLL